MGETWKCRSGVGGRDGTRVFSQRFHRRRGLRTGSGLNAPRRRGLSGAKANRGAGSACPDAGRLVGPRPGSAL